MACPKFLNYLWLFIALTLLLSISACTKTYEVENFTFTAPFQYKTTIYNPPQFNSTTNSEVLLLSNVSHYPFFLINRQKIPLDSNLETVFADYKLRISQKLPHYQFMSENAIMMNNRKAIEYLHCEYLGEPYVQSREIWMEYEGWAYSLVCVHSGNGPSCELISLSDKCVFFFENLKFK